GMVRTPIDPFAIATQLEIEVRGSESLGDAFSGCLLVHGTTVGILYSTSIASRGFQRFTISHELGHHQLTQHHPLLFADGGKDLSQSNFTSQDWKEAEADHFAAELLMPEPLFRKAINGVAIGHEGVKALADQFETSLTSTAIRYAQMTPDPVAIVMTM